VFVSLNSSWRLLAIFFCGFSKSVFGPDANGVFQIWGFHGGDCKECRLLGCYAMWLSQEPCGVISQKTAFFELFHLHFDGNRDAANVHMGTEISSYCECYLSTFDRVYLDFPFVGQFCKRPRWWCSLLRLLLDLHLKTANVAISVSSLGGASAK
jgi:hypothetical protein